MERIQSADAHTRTHTHTHTLSALASLPAWLISSDSFGPSADLGSGREDEIQALLTRSGANQRRALAAKGASCRPACQRSALGCSGLAGWRHLKVSVLARPLVSPLISCAAAFEASRRR